ncbi:1-(5-phosphoribosyl)-5-[(5-phosphoribosylamino)methylideneamino]imidazole-4-carboxamide isomerase, partial [Buchnera aphidicola (Hormaphis cornu)]
MIIPAIDLFEGKIVRLYQGKYEKINTYNIDIDELLDIYKLQGAHTVHLVDLNGAINPNNNQFDLLINILKKTTMSIQVGGGIRNKVDVERLLLAGAKRIVIGSIAIQKEKDVKKWFQEFGADLIVLALDLEITKDNYKEVKISAWKEFTGVTLEDLIDKYSDLGLKHVLCTDISKDGTLVGPNLNLYKEITQRFPHIHFQSSGGISTLSDIFQIKQTNVKDVIIGKALLENKFSLKEAIQCWQKG